MRRQTLTFRHHVKEKVETIAESLGADVPTVAFTSVHALAEMGLSERDGDESAVGGQHVAHLQTTVTTTIV